MNAADTIRERVDELALEVTRAHEESHPERFRKFGPAGRTRCLEDSRSHLQYLATALDASCEALFLDYIGWTKVVLSRRNIGEHDLIESLTALARTLSQLPDAATYVGTAIERLPSMPDDVPSHLDPRAPLWAVASEYLTLLLRGERADAVQLVLRALDGGAPLRAIYRHVFEPVQYEIGRLWQLNRITVAQEHFCTAVTQQVMTRLYARVFEGPKRESRAVAMCVGGELHEIGLRIVTDLLEVEGWQTWYLGANVPPAAAVELCAEQKADVLLISATLPPHLREVSEVIRRVRANPALAEKRVLVGGRAFRNAPGLWRTIGADGYGANADDCLALLTGT